MIESNLNYEVYYEAVVSYLSQMKSSKDDGDSQLDFKKDFLEELIPIELLNNEMFLKLFDIAWKNCEDNEKCFKELDNFMKAIKGKFEEAVVLSKAIIAYQFLTKMAKDEFTRNSTIFKEALTSIVFKRTSSFIKSAECEKVYEVAPVEKKFDKFGPWEIDPLFNHLKVFLILQNEADFPLLWRTDKKKTALSLEEKPLDYHLFIEIKKNDLTLNRFLQKELNLNDPKQLEQITEKLKKSYSIFSIQNLLDISNWDTFDRDFPAHSAKLQRCIDGYRNETFNSIKKSTQKSRTEAELLGDWNKAKLFLFYESNMQKELDGQRFGFINKIALKKGFQEQRNDPDFDGGPILNDIEKVIEHFTEPDLPLRKKSHGLLLYGPPGTGKTQLCSVIINKAGLFGLVPPLSSSELNRSKVGETEQLLISIFHRALYVPYLLCCIAIDEVDALTPKRNEKSGEHKVDILCLLLSLIGGIKDVSNVFVIGSTNRLNKIDEAFARRLQDKFYVGRLNAEQRINLMKKIKEEKVQLPKNVRIDFDSKSYQPRIELYNILTTNFSGAAMVALRSHILHFFDTNKSTSINDIDDENLIRLCSKVANDFSVKIGAYSIPTLIKDNNINELSEKLKSCFKSEELSNLSGRILIDLRVEINNIQFENIDGTLKEVDLDPSRKHASDIVPILLMLAIIFKVPYFQLIDSNMVLSNAAFDENTSIEIILEKFTEFEQYENSMFAYDADTLVGISESMSDSAMSESLSYSVQNSRIWQQIILQSFKMQAKSKNLTDHKWCILISSSEFLINQFKKLVKFELCKEEHDLMVKKRLCANCGEEFVEKYNKSDACSFHIKSNLERIIISDQQRHSLSYTKEELIRRAGEIGNDGIFNDYYYLCCMKKVRESGHVKVSNLFF